MKWWIALRLVGAAIILAAVLGGLGPCALAAGAGIVGLPDVIGHSAPPRRRGHVAYASTRKRWREEEEARSRRHRPLRFYRGAGGRIHFYRKVDQVRLAQLEREVGLREPYEAERTKAINKVRKATTRDIDSWSGVLQAFAAVYRVPPACDGAASGKETARNRNCVERNDYVVLPPGWELKHYSDSNPPPLPVLTESRDTL